MPDYDMKIIELDTIGSTNDYTKALDGSVYLAPGCSGSAGAGPAFGYAREGTRPVLVTALEQTAGRGRYGRSFYSPRGTGIYMTYSFRPRFSPEDSIRTTLVTAAVVHKALSSYTEDPLIIKWVNDIYRNKRKIAGILVEGVSADGEALDRLVIGIGINLFPSPVAAELADKVGFLFDGIEGSAERPEASYERARRGIISSVASGLSQAFFSGGSSGCNGGTGASAGDERYDLPGYIAYYKRFCYNYPDDIDI